jgi:putative sigma-54 modulation protein
MAMQVTVKGKNVDVPERVRDRATRKLSKISRFDDRILTMDVEFSEERNPRVADQHRVEVTCTTKAHLIRAEASGTDPVSAIDRVVDRLERQVKKLKGQRTSRKQQDTRVLAESAEAQGSLVGPAGDEASPIVRFKHVEMKPMTGEEAVTVMDLLGYDFYLFTNVQTDGPAVVYRRRNGDFGLIEPEA